MKQLITFFSILFSIATGFCQSYNADNVAWVNYLIRMYENSPFEGVRMVDDYDSQHLISVVALEKSKYTDSKIMTRVASIKAASQANDFFNGSNITTDLVIRTSEKADGSSDTVIIENIKTQSAGYVQGLQQLTNFETNRGKTIVFIYSCQIQNKQQEHSQKKKRK